MGYLDLQSGCPELEDCFSRAELNSRPGEARLVVQSATPDMHLRDSAISRTPGKRNKFLNGNNRNSETKLDSFTRHFDSYPHKLFKTFFCLFRNSTLDAADD